MHVVRTQVSLVILYRLSEHAYACVWSLIYVVVQLSAFNIMSCQVLVFGIQSSV